MTNDKAFVLEYCIGIILVYHNMTLQCSSVYCLDYSMSLTLPGSSVIGEQHRQERQVKRGRETGSEMVQRQTDREIDRGVTGSRRDRQVETASRQKCRQVERQPGRQECLHLQ